MNSIQENKLAFYLGILLVLIALFDLPLLNFLLFIAGLSMILLALFNKLNGKLANFINKLPVVNLSKK